MPDRLHNLAIETSGRTSSVTLGRGDVILESATLPPLQRHSVDLLPTIDALCSRHRVSPTDLAEVYVSTGPGSFTGLRIGIASAKALALALDVRLVAAPTIEALACNVPASSATLAVAVNLKGESVYAGVFARAGDAWRLTEPARLVSFAELISSLPKPALVLGDPLPAIADEAARPGVTLLPAEFAIARSEHVWHLGRSLAKQNRFTDANALLPLYVRPPEAEEVWKKRAAK